MIYKRFTEKSAEEWRQIYKALQLLEFLIKNGSERVIDDARSHLSLLKMLRQFHYIDLNGKDQGINVRNRAKELADLLGDVDKIRTERKKARANRNKYGGYEGGGGFAGGLGGSSGRMGGFGSESGGANANYGGYSGGVYGDGGGFGGEADGTYSGDTQSRRDKFEEYDEYDEGAVAAPGRRQADQPSSPARARREPKKTTAPKPKEPEVDLFDFGDEPTTSTASASNGKAPATNNALGDFGADDDEFDDFQSAGPTPAPAKPAFTIPPPASTSTTTSATQFAQPKPVSATQGQNINDLFASVSPPPPSSGSAFSPLSPPTTTSFQNKPPQPSGYQATGPNYFQSVSVPTTSSGTSTPSQIGGAKPKAAGGDAFASLLGGGAKKTGPVKGSSMADMARQKASAGIWGASAPATPQGGSAPAPQQQKAGNGLDDLLG
jgi:epsin